MRNTTTINKKLCWLWITLTVVHFASLLFKKPAHELVSQSDIDKLNKNQFWYCITDFICWYMMALIIRVKSVEKEFIYMAVTVQDIAIFMMVILFTQNPFQWSGFIVFDFWATIVLAVPFLFLNTWANKILNLK